jgi:hypothetical protein
MKLFCKGNHWKLVKGELILDTPTGKDTETALRLSAVIEARVRLQIYNEICDLKLLENRRAITKAGIENVALTVQAFCADVALKGRKE